MAFKDNSNKYNYMMYNVGSNDAGMRSQGISINASQSNVDLSGYEVLGIINYGSGGVVSSATFSNGGTISNLNLKLKQFYPLSLSSISTGINNKILIFVRDK